MATTVAQVPRTAAQEESRTKWLTLGAMCFALFMMMLDNTVVNVALPTIQQKFNATTSALEWIVNGYTLSLAVLMVTMGKLGDIFGRKRLFLIGLTVFTAASFACGVAPNLGSLVFFRVLQGLGGSIMMPGTLSIITATFQGKERAQAIGIWAGISGLALAAGPIVGGALVQYVNWQAIFFVNIPIGIIAFLVATRVVRESYDTTAARSVDYLGVATLTPSIFALTLALIEGQGWGWGSGRILGLFAAAVLFLIAFVVAENRQANPMVHFPMFRSPAFLAANVITFVLTFGMFGSIFFLTLYMQNVLGYSALQSGLRTLPMTGMIIFSAPLSGRLIGRLGGRPIVFTGMTLVGLGLLIDSRRLTAHSAYTALLPSFILIGVGIGFAMSPLSSIAMGAVERTKAGVASGVLGMVRQLGGVFGIALLGAIFANRSHSHVVSAVATLPVPDAVKAQIVANASLGRGGGTLPGADPAIVLQIKDAVLGGVVQGLTDAMLIGAIACAIGAVLALTLARPAEEAEMPAMATAEAEHERINEPALV
ncbi:MAG: MFS transporter [Thermomicrobiales bacterium]